MNDASQILISLGQVIALGSFVMWLSRRNLDKIEKVATDVAIIINEVKYVRDDHDRLILNVSRTDKLERDITAAHEKIRAFN